MAKKTKCKVNAAKVNAEAIFSTLAAQNPHPVTELFYTNDFTLLVAIVLSAQATDAGVNKATPALFKAADTPKKMAALGEAKIKSYIKTIGLFNAKARNVFALSKMVMEEYSGEIPSERTALERLPGVGSKTAAVWLNCARGDPTIGVDTHVFRVANRLGLCNTKSAPATEMALGKVIPQHWLRHAHHWLILHGRYVCKARKPDCRNCVIREWCEFGESLKSRA